MGQISVKIYAPPGSLLSNNQQPKAMQRLVDDIQQALRLGDEERATQCAQVLAQIERLLDHH